MPSQKEAPESRALQKVYIHGENGTLITIPQAYVIVENNNEILGQESCSEQSRLVDRNETAVVHIIENTDSRQADEDLTSLNWLQDINVINGIPLQAKGSLEIQTVHAAVSQIKGVTLPSSRNGRASEPHSETESSCDGSNLSLSEINLSLGSNHRNEAEDSSNKVILSKPPHSFSTLIFLAIESSPAKAMPVRDIYAWITQHFPYYRYAPAGWKNSVRHNLSLSKSFTKVQQYPGVGKGSLWKVDPLHRPQLIQSLRKIPDFSAEQLEQIIAGNSNDNSPAKSSASENAESPEAISKDSLRLTPSSSSSSSSPYSHRSNVPDPALFPYLSRRLQTTPPDNSAGLASSQPRADVDAATAMLALRQEFVLTVPMHSSVKKCYSPRRTRDHSYEQQIVENDSFIHEVQEEVEVRSTTHTSPTEEDHTYSFCPRPSRLRPVHKAINKRLEPTRNHLESYPSASGSRQVIKNEPAALLHDDSDTLESANALLGLAGIKRIHEVTEDPPAVKGSPKNGQDQKKVKLSEKRGRGRMRGRSRK